MVNWLIINISFTVSRSGDCLQHLCTTQFCHRLGFITLSIYIFYIHTHQDWKQVKAVYLKSWAKGHFSISFQSKILILILILILVTRSEDTSSDLRLIFLNCKPWGSHAVGQLLLLKCCGTSIWISWFYCSLFFLLEHVLAMFTSHLLICCGNLRLLPFYCRLRNAVQYFHTVGGRYNSLMAVYIPRLSFFLKLYWVL